MRIHLIRADKLAERLAKHSVGATEQTAYLAASAVAWLVIFYGFVIPPIMDDGSSWFWMMWGYEFVTLIAINILGYFYCLRHCWIDPDRNFMIDFWCLYTPVAITTLVVVWVAFHGFGWISGALAMEVIASKPEGFILKLLWLPTFLDVLRYLAYAGGSVVIFFRIAKNMERVSKARAAANQALQGSR